MANNRHNFNINLSGIDEIQEQLSATSAQVIKSCYRAINRTAVTLRTLAAKEIAGSIQARKIMDVRKRFKQSVTRSGNRYGLTMWFGLNDFPVSQLKGKLKRIGTKKRQRGAMFTRPNGEVIINNKAFIARVYGKKSMFTRVSKERFPLKEETVAVDEILNKQIKDNIYSKANEIFMNHFKTDLRGRTRMNL